MLRIRTTRVSQDAVGPRAGRVVMRYSVRVTAQGGQGQVIQRTQVAEAAIGAASEVDRVAMDVWTTISWEAERTWLVDVYAQVKDPRLAPSSGR